jgi:hypothetical protein
MMAMMAMMGPKMGSVLVSLCRSSNDRVYSCQVDAGELR